jgi:hypothetical protein
MDQQTLQNDFHGPLRTWDERMDPPYSWDEGIFDKDLPLIT